MNDEKTFEVKEVNKTMTNGRFDFKNSASGILGRSEVTYFNPKNGKYQTQNYLTMQDVVVPVILKRSKSGELMFAMQYESNPSANGILLELPECPFFREKKDVYSNGDVTECIEERLESLGLEMEGFRYLDSSETAVNQSITDQLMKVVSVYAEEKEEIEDNGLIWFPISSLEDYLSDKKANENELERSSLQTKYALRLFYNKYKEEIKKWPPTEFKYDEKMINENGENWEKQKTIMEHKYRFGLQLAEKKGKENPEIQDFGQVSEYGTSKNSVECLVTKKDGKRIKIGLSKQQRSPHINREGVSEYFYEEVGGMLEPTEDYETALKREVPEETGIQVKNGKIVHLSNPIILSKGTQECSAFYLYEMADNDVQGEKKLDQQECIENIEWFYLDEIDLEKLHAPLPTKYAILKAREYYKELEKIKSESFDLEER